MKFISHLLAYIASFWTLSREKSVYLHGRHLNSTEKTIAERLNIENISQIRILALTQITHPLSWSFRIFSFFSRSVISFPVGLTLGHSILVKKDYELNLQLIAHELVHVRQYEELKGHVPFLKKYIYQCLKHGYHNCPLELEAESNSKALFMNQNDV